MKRDKLAKGADELWKWLSRFSAACIPAERDYSIMHGYTGDRRSEENGVVEAAVITIAATRVEEVHWQVRQHAAIAPRSAPLCLFHGSQREPAQPAAKAERSQATHANSSTLDSAPSRMTHIASGMRDAGLGSSPKKVQQSRHI